MFPSKILSIQECFEVKTGSGNLTNELCGFCVETEAGEIWVVISSMQDCCEEWGYIHSEDDLQSFVGATLLSAYTTDDALINYPMPEENCERATNTVFVTFETNQGKFQLVVYNNHNGYYGHRALVSLVPSGSRPVDLFDDRL